jgi:hypothetical protein
MPALSRSAISTFEQAVLDEPAVDLVHDGDFGVRAGHQDHAVGLQALVLAARSSPFTEPDWSISTRRRP